MMSGYTAREVDREDIIIEELRGAVRTFEACLNKIGKRTFRDQGVQSEEPEENCKLKDGAVATASCIHECRVTGENCPGRGDGGSGQQADGLATSGYLFPSGLRSSYTNRLNDHETAMKKLSIELEHFENHIRHAGGDEAVAQASEAIRSELSKATRPIRSMLNLGKDVDVSGLHDAVSGVYDAFRGLTTSVDAFHTSVYQQRHAFYFRGVSEWSRCCAHGYTKLAECDWSDKGSVKRLMHYVCAERFPDLERSMNLVTTELHNFGEKTLPTFISDERERATTRYIHITTIATFFSSVTATTLQLSLTYHDSKYYSAVNLLWFLSLVFSVSSGVSSLIGMTWRKSSIYNTTTPPQLIGLWLDKAPMIFLIVAALTFIVGLNIFVYLSSQVRYVSLSTNALTGAHSFCLLIVITWFLYRLKYETRPIKWIMDKLRSWIFWLCKSQNSLHFQRNVYWAFELDSRVAELNDTIGWNKDWPSPNRVSRPIRFIVHALRAITRKFGIIAKSLVRRTNGADTGTDDRDQIPAEEALAEYRQKLEHTFGKSKRIDNIIRRITLWTNGDWKDERLKQHLSRRLWGYPQLVDIVFDSELVNVRRENLDKRDEGKGKSDGMAEQSLPRPDAEVHSECAAQDTDRPLSLSHTFVHRIDTDDHNQHGAQSPYVCSCDGVPSVQIAPQQTFKHEDPAMMISEVR